MKPRRAETVLLVLLALIVGCAVVFMVVFSFEHLAHQTQYLCLALGGAFVLLAAACILIATNLVVTEEIEGRLKSDIEKWGKVIEKAGIQKQ